MKHSFLKFCVCYFSSLVHQNRYKYGNFVLSITKLNMFPFMYLYFKASLNCLAFQMVGGMFTSLIFWTYLFNQN